MMNEIVTFGHPSLKSKSVNIQNDFLPLVLNNFSLSLLEAPKENRRSFIDYLMFHVEHEYKIDHLKFKKALAQRNRALKKSSSSELKSWTKVFIDLSQKLTKKKLQFIDSFLKSMKMDLKKIKYIKKAFLKISYRLSMKNDSLTKLAFSSSKLNTLNGVYL